MTALLCPAHVSLSLKTISCRPHYWAKDVLLPPSSCFKSKAEGRLVPLKNLAAGLPVCPPRGLRYLPFAPSQTFRHLKTTKQLGLLKGFDRQNNSRSVRIINPISAWIGSPLPLPKLKVQEYVCVRLLGKGNSRAKMAAIATMHFVCAVCGYFPTYLKAVTQSLVLLKKSIQPMTTAQHIWRA